MPTVFISGANRGIGFEFARQYRAEGWTVHGTARVPAEAADLAMTGAMVHPLDVADEASIDALAKRLDGAPIDVLIANAGVSGDLSLTPEQVTAREILEVMTVNTFAPLRLAASLEPNLRAGTLRRACAISSLMSSITANDWGTQYVYRASKSALNVVWHTLAQEWRPQGICCVLLRPGYVRTRMTGFDSKGIDVGESVSGMRRVVDGLTLADSGRLIGYDGLDVPW